MSLTGLLIFLTITAGSIVVAGIIARPGRPLIAHAAIVLGLGLLLRLGGAAAYSVMTKEPYLLTRAPFSDEKVFVRASSWYMSHPGDWYRELALHRSTRFSAALHGLRLLTPNSGPSGLRLITVALSVSGILAVWAAARRRLSSHSAFVAALAGVIWPYACQHDVGIVREPWMTFACGWSVALLAALERRPLARYVTGAMASYFFYLLQPHAAFCVAVAFLLAEFGAPLARLPRATRIAVVILGIAGFAVVGGMLSLKVYYQQALVEDIIEGYTRRGEGGSAFWMPGPDAPLWLLWATNSGQYWLGGLFIGMTSASRLLGLVDYAFWLPIYGAAIKHLGRGRWARMGRPERFAVACFVFYNVLSMGYVNNVGQSVRKRNAFGIAMIYVMAAALSAAHEASAGVRSALAHHKERLRVVE